MSLLTLLVASLSACTQPAVISPTMTPTTAPAMTPTTAPTTDVPCGFMWAYREAPEIAERAQPLLDGAGIPTTLVKTRLFGEECSGDPNSQLLVMSTIFEIEIPVANLADQAALGDLVAQIVTALSGIGETPGVQRDLRLLFIAGEERGSLQTTLEQAEQAYANGARGAALIEALGGVR